MKKITLLFTLLVAGAMFAQTNTAVKNSNGVAIVINEIDADQTGTDEMEFIELYSDGASASLDGLVVVLFNGSDDASYNAIDLTGFSTDANGYFLIGGDAVPGVDIALGADNVIQNGADAVGIYVGNAVDYPTDTPATETSLQQALVYGTSDDDDVDLLAALGETIQYDENINGNKDTESIQRAADGTYCVGAPTPRATNIDCNATCPLSVFVVSVDCDAVTDGVDTYTTTLSFTGGGTAAYTITATEGTISGDNPSTVADGSIIISGVNEGVDFDYSVTGGNCDITNTINAQDCEPATVVNNIAELRAGVVGNVYTLSGEAIVTFQQTFRNQKFIEDATAAILIDDVNGNITSIYSIGDGVTGITGFLGDFNGMAQFSVIEDAGAASSTGNTVAPQTVTVAQLNANPNDYESELVQLDIFNIDTNGDTEWSSGIEYLMIENGSGDQYTFRTTFFDADYIGEPFMQEVFITGLITERDNGSYFITARSLDDFTTTAGVAENNIEGFTVTPNPAKTQVTFSTVASEILNVAIYDVTGKQVMNIANAQGTVNVSNLTTGIYIVRATENGQTSIAKLVIE